MKITLTVPDSVYQEASQIAHSNNRPLEEVLRERVQWFHSPFHVSQDSLLMEREVAIFEAKHSQLYSQYPNQYIAMHEGQVVDHDDELMPLVKRRRQQYPNNEVVLIRQVLPELPKTLMFRSPRQVRNDSLFT